MNLFSVVSNPWLDSIACFFPKNAEYYGILSPLQKIF